jgi:hypothetical protein
MSLATLTAALLFAQAQFAPSDVPKNHWAYPAVDRLFQEGLLKGYPSGGQPTLVLDIDAKLDKSQFLLWKSQWESNGLLAGYSHWGGRHSDPGSKYEMAVIVHSSWANARGALESKEPNGKDPAAILKLFPSLAKAISMLNPELTKLGVDTKQLIATLNDLQDSRHRLFVGNR